MGCLYAIETDEYHGYECSVSGVFYDLQGD